MRKAFEIRDQFDTTMESLRVIERPASRPRLASCRPSSSPRPGRRLHSPTPSSSSPKTPPSCRVRASAGAEASTRTLGASGLTVSTVGLGTIGWGDESYGFNSRYRAVDLRETFEAAVEGGITFFDTAEVYGYKQHEYQSSSEHLLGDFAGEASEPVIIGSKVFTIPWTNLIVKGTSPRLGSEALVDALKKSVERVGRPVDLWSIHFPFPTFKNSVLMDALKEASDLGLTTAIGVSNFSKDQMIEASEICSRLGIKLSANQVKFSLLDRSNEKNGLLSAAEALDVAVVAYSPLAGGKLTSSGAAKNPKDDKLAELLKLMEFVGVVNGGKSISQVALNWLVRKGALPIPSARSAEQAREHAGAMGWSLDDNEMSLLEEKLEYLGW